MRLQNIPNETQCKAATVLAYVLKQFPYSCARKRRTDIHYIVFLVCLLNFRYVWKILIVYVC